MHLFPLKHVNVGNVANEWIWMLNVKVEFVTHMWGFVWMQDGAFKISNKWKVWNVDTTSDLREAPQTLRIPYVQM